MLKPRFYQQEAHDAAIKWVKQYSDPCLLGLPMGSGKSIIVAMLAKTMHELSGGKRVLCLCPNRELVQQNFSKYISIGGKASIYSASISKSLRHPVTFGTEQTFIKIAEREGERYTCVIVDEAHKVTNTMMKIIEDMKKGNPNLRVIGLTATPYALNKGYVFSLDEDNKLVQETVDPYYKKRVYNIGADELIKLGYLTPPMVGLTQDEYDTSGLELKNGKFSDKQLAEAFEGKSTTEKIIQDILQKSKDRKRVLIFASTIRHAKEIQALIPNSGLVTGETPKKEREQLLSDFAIGKIKYMINVAILTTGYDLPILDCIAILRPTESAGLYQQIIGRGTRLAEGKTDFLVLDYAKNIEQFFEGKSSIFEPNVKAFGSKPQEKLSIMCEYCGTEQEHTRRPGYSNTDSFGYAMDEAGDRLDPPIPSTYARRCVGVSLIGRNQYARCDYYWTHRTCEECGAKADIAARACNDCGKLFIDPNSKLSETATVLEIGHAYTARVDSMSVRHGEVLHVEWETPHGTLKSRFFPNHKQWAIAHHGKKFLKETDHGNKPPKMITYTKQKTGYCSINEYHQV
ncbi:DEAD/DEAH box helicase family protein [Jeotgalibaca porci]|uniref:DEAD/DEAH box helicase family protein n=1 Tax=Jeotgalibaca porci TaxID=1868793 RepID=UPI0035A1D0FF